MEENLTKDTPPKKMRSPQPYGVTALFVPGPCKKLEEARLEALVEWSRSYLQVAFSGMLEDGPTL